MSPKSNGKAKSVKSVAKIDTATAYKQVQNASKILSYLEENAGFKPNTVSYARKLVEQWGQALLVKEQEKKALAELKARQKKELEAARASLAEQIKKNLAG